MILGSLRFLFVECASPAGAFDLQEMVSTSLPPLAERHAFFPPPAASKWTDHSAPEGLSRTRAWCQNITPVAGPSPRRCRAPPSRFHTPSEEARAEPRPAC